MTDEPVIENLSAAIAHLRHLVANPEDHPYTAPAAELVLASLDRVVHLCAERAGGMLAPSEVMAAVNGRKR